MDVLRLLNVAPTLSCPKKRSMLTKPKGIRIYTLQKSIH